VNSPFLSTRVPALIDEVVDVYRAAGRPLASLSDQDLDERFVSEVENYIEDPQNAARFRSVNTTAAEYMLRRRAAPVAKVLRLKKGSEHEARNQPHKPKLAVFLDVPSEDYRLPMVVLAFGRFAVIPALGAIAQPEGSNGKPLRPDTKEDEDELQREFNWLIGL
jgi:hypothetical protein